MTTIEDARTEQEAPQSVSPNRLHSAFRYGIRLSEPSGTKTLGRLEEILVWLRGELG